MRRGQFAPKWRRLDARLIQMIGEGKRPAEVAEALGHGVTKAAVIQRAASLRSAGVACPKFKRPPRGKRAPVVAPDVVPLVQRAISEDPAGRKPRGAQAEVWPIHLAAYVAHVELGYSTFTVGRAIGRGPKIVTYAARRIEERRDDDPAFDSFLERLAEQARELAA